MLFIVLFNVHVFLTGARSIFLEVQYPTLRIIYKRDASQTMQKPVKGGAAVLKVWRRLVSVCLYMTSFSYLFMSFFISVQRWVTCWPTRTIYVTVDIILYFAPCVTALGPARLSSVGVLSPQTTDVLCGSRPFSVMLRHPSSWWKIITWQQKTHIVNVGIWQWLQLQATVRRAEKGESKFRQCWVKNSWWAAYVPITATGIKPDVKGLLKRK